VLWESTAILTYLVSKYDANSTLYPLDVQQRALVDQWLLWGVSTLFPVGYPLDCVGQVPFQIALFNNLGVSACCRTVHLAASLTHDFRRPWARCFKGMSGLRRSSEKTKKLVLLHMPRSKTSTSWLSRFESLVDPISWGAT
jgi:hypothetical protein